MATTTAYPIGSVPPVGEVPPRMLAQVVRQDRLGDPIDAFQIEEIDTPSIKADEVLVAVMAAGINYNNVWAARGIPIDIIATRQKAGVDARTSTSAAATPPGSSTRSARTSTT